MDTEGKAGEKLEADFHLYLNEACIDRFILRLFMTLTNWKGQKIVVAYCIFEYILFQHVSERYLQKTSVCSPKLEPGT